MGPVRYVMPARSHLMLKKYWTACFWRAMIAPNEPPVSGGVQLFPKQANMQLTASSASNSESFERKPTASERFMPEPLLDSDQAAAIMQIHPKTLQRYARQGIVRGFQLGTMWRFRASEIERWIQERMAS